MGLGKEASIGGNPALAISFSVWRSSYRSEACGLPAALKYLFGELGREQGGREGKQMAATVNWPLL